MALPAFPTDNATNNTGGAGSVSAGATFGYPDITAGRSAAIVQATAFTGAVNTTGGAVTCNLATDTLIFLPEGGVWDDTQSCWLPPYIVQIPPTPRR